MTHDPLCPIEPNPLAKECRTCDLIAKVREDTLNQARALITALACPITVAEGHCEECEQYREALACVESLRVTP